MLLAASGAARISAMQQMAQHFEETDVPLALDVLLQLAEEWGTERLFSPENRSVVDMLRVLLLDPPKQLFQIVAERTSGMDTAQQDALRRLLIALGVMSRRLSPDRWRHELSATQLDLIWRFWPALGTALERSALILGERGACSRARHRLGLDTLVPLRRSTGNENGREVEDAEELSRQGAAVVFPDMSALCKLCGGPPEDALLSVPADRLREVARELNIIPSGLLAEDQWLGTNLAWLIDLKTDPIKERAATGWLRRNTQWLYSSIEALSDESRVPPALLELANKRIPRSDLNPLAVLPYAVGATALILRLLANDPISARILCNTQQELDLAGLKMIELAPDLFERDLCIIELALAQVTLSEEPS